MKWNRGIVATGGDHILVGGISMNGIGDQGPQGRRRIIKYDQDCANAGFELELDWRQRENVHTDPGFERQLVQRNGASD